MRVCRLHCLSIKMVGGAANDSKCAYSWKARGHGGRTVQPCTLTCQRSAIYIGIVVHLQDRTRSQARQASALFKSTLTLAINPLLSVSADVRATPTFSTVNSTFAAWSRELLAEKNVGHITPELYPACSDACMRQGHMCNRKHTHGYCAHATRLSRRGINPVAGQCKFSIDVIWQQCMHLHGRHAARKRLGRQTGILQTRNP